MYLASLDIINYRAIQHLKLNFQPGLNVIVGENNTGKTALLDALRILFGQGSGKRDIYISSDDIHHDNIGNPTATSCEFHATFKGLNDDEQGSFSTCLCPTLGMDVAQIHIKYEMSNSLTGRFRFSIWGGEHEGENIPTDVLDGIRSVYLEALRDAKIGLRPGRGSKISQLLQVLVKDESEKLTLEEIAGEANQRIVDNDLVQRAISEINKRLKEVTGETLSQRADLKLSAPEFRRITESLRALVGNTKTFEIEENGLGYNNLLYMATVLGELQKASEIDYAALLIEEPEAHLHPHLQSVLVDYLQSVSNGALTTSRMPEAAEADSQSSDSDLDIRTPVQVFVTSHSPCITSRVDLGSLNLLYIGPEDHVVSYEVSNCQFEGKERDDLRRYLDVTKAQLFFAKGVIFVEGISEALLLPELAKLIELPLEQHAISVVNVQSLAFRPFAKLFQAGAIQLPAAIITDSDPTNGEPSATSQRISELAGGMLRVYTGEKTLEYDMALSGNASRMAEIYKTLHPLKGVAMESAVASSITSEQKAQAVWDNFDSNDKAVFAQRIAHDIAENPAGYTVPGYITNAIKYVCRAE